MSQDAAAPLLELGEGGLPCELAAGVKSGHGWRFPAASELHIDQGESSVGQYHNRPNKLASSSDEAEGVPAMRHSLRMLVKVDTLGDGAGGNIERHKGGGLENAGKAAKAGRVVVRKTK